MRLMFFLLATALITVSCHHKPDPVPMASTCGPENDILTNPCQRQLDSLKAEFDQLGDKPPLIKGDSTNLHLKVIDEVNGLAAKSKKAMAGATIQALYGLQFGYYVSRSLRLRTESATAIGDFQDLADSLFAACTEIMDLGSDSVDLSRKRLLLNRLRRDTQRRVRDQASSALLTPRISDLTLGVAFPRIDLMSQTTFAAALDVAKGAVNVSAEKAEFLAQVAMNGNALFALEGIRVQLRDYVGGTRSASSVEMQLTRSIVDIFDQIIEVEKNAD